MTSRASIIAWTLFGLSIALALGALALLWAEGATPRSSILEDSFNTAVNAIVVPIWGAVGAVIAVHRPRNAIGWLLLANAVAQSLSIFGGEYAFYGLIVEPGSVPGAGLVSLSYGVLWTITLSAISLALLLFPDGRLLSRWWLPVAGIALIPTIFIPVGLVVSWPYRGVRLVTESFPSDASSVIDTLITVVIVSAMIAILLAGVSLIVRFRRGRVVERQQIKWLAVAAFLLLFDGLTSELLAVEESWRYLLSALAFTSIPIAIGLAVFRYRLYDVDRIINRALVYSALTATLAASYVGVVLALQSVLPVPDDSSAIIAASTLVMAALFAPARRRIQGFVDRRFYRGRFDAARAIESFGTRLRTGTDLGEVTHALAEVAQTTMQPASVSVWVRPASRS